ncbi:uncharacterized protein LOC34619756 [Cyclospora cayetanensis]|uniref:Uncharacterized protein LOC34619756 n=1 Tax=Cyclospora cayetanensis TaxID=88456 RepID=A0A6P6RZT6_9EIME|nr:uncharacterized protein LOC34619756 [Cyclospora cayetanensis]
MVFGMAISSHAIYHPELQNNPLAVLNAKLCLAMYVSHAFLFSKFYLEAFCKEFRSGEATFLMFFHAFAVAGLVKLVLHDRCWPLFADSRDHRVHHKNSDREGDPYNASRGFFYSHVGWLLLKKPQAVKDAGRQLNFDDLLADPFVRLQHKLDPWWNQFWCFLAPALYAYYRYNDFWSGFFILGCLRWCICLHATWTVNSTAHLWGDRRYNVEGNPCESCFTSLVAVGEGWHDWHHAYPFDYAASEGGVWDQYNPSKLLIDVCAFFGMAWDRRRATVAWKMLQSEREQHAAGRRQREADARKNCEALAAVHSLREVVRVKSAHISTLQSLVSALSRCLKVWSSGRDGEIHESNHITQASPFGSSWCCPVCASAVEFGLGRDFTSGRLYTYVVVLLCMHRSVGHPSAGPHGGLAVRAPPPTANREQFGWGWGLLHVGWPCSLLQDNRALLRGAQRLRLCACQPSEKRCATEFHEDRFVFCVRVGRGCFADDVMNNNCQFDFLCVAPSALRWVKARLEKRRREGMPQLMKAIHVLHHRPLDLHLLQAITFEVPLHRVQEAVCFLKERVELMPAEVFSASLSDGFANIHPEARLEYYNTVEHPGPSRRPEETAASAGGDTEKKTKGVDETAFASSSSTLTKRTRAVGS